MSVRYMSAIWRLLDLTQTETLVALAIADHADAEGFCFPSLDRIAEKARISKRHTRRIVRQLEAGGVLLVDRSVATGRGKPSHYRLLIEPVGADDIELDSRPEKGDTEAPKKGGHGPAKKGDNRSPIAEKGGHGRPLKGDITVSPESSYNHQEEEEGGRPPGKGAAKHDWQQIDGLDVEAWEAWLRFRSASKMPAYTTPRAARNLAGYPSEIQRMTIETSMTQQWRGLFPERARAEYDKQTRDGGKITRYEHADAILEAWLRESAS